MDPITLIRESSVFYLLPLNFGSRSANSRFSLYSIKDGKLINVLPEHEYKDETDPNDRGTPKRWSELQSLGFVHTDRQQYPAYHLCINGGGFRKEYDIKLRIDKLRRSLQFSDPNNHGEQAKPFDLYLLDGAIPSPV